MKLYYKDFYGSTATINATESYVHLVCKTIHGDVVKNGLYKSVASAKSALYRLSDSWTKVGEKK